MERCAFDANGFPRPAVAERKTQTSSVNPIGKREQIHDFVRRTQRAEAQGQILHKAIERYSLTSAPSVVRRRKLKLIARMKSIGSQRLIEKSYCFRIRTPLRALSQQLM